MNDDNKIIDNHKERKSLTCEESRWRLFYDPPVNISIHSEDSMEG